MSKNKPQPQKTTAKDAKSAAPKKDRKAPEPRLIKPQAERSVNGFTRALNSIEESFAGLLPEGLMGALRSTREQLAGIASGIDPMARRSRGERPAVEFAMDSPVFFNKTAEKSLKSLIVGRAAFKGYAPGTKSAMANVLIVKDDGAELPLCVPTAYLRKRPEIS